MNANARNALALLAASGIVLGACGGSKPPVTPVGQDPASADQPKAACSAGHTDDKNHCAAAADAGAP